MNAITTLAEARQIAASVFALQAAAVEVEIAMVFGSVWIGRDMKIYDKPRFAN